MAFEAAVPFEDKKRKLEELAASGVLTKSDLENCLKALRKEPTQKNVIYRDKNIAVTYRGFEEVQDYTGKKIKVFLVIENRTKEVLGVRARGSINGIVVENDAIISREVPERSKIICCAEFPISTLKYVDVNSAKDIETISFLFRAIDSHYGEISKATKQSVVIVK